MTLIQRNELKAAMDTLQQDSRPAVLLFFGERYLCRKAVEEAQHALLSKNKGVVFAIEGEQEDAGQTLAKLMSFSLLPGLQIYRVDDTRLFHSKNVSETVWHKADLAFKAQNTGKATKYLRDMYRLSATPQQQWQPFAELTRLQWQEMFGMEKPADLGWTEPLFDDIAKMAVSATSSLSLAEKYMEVFEKGMPPNNILILVAETVDKRKKLFSYIKKHGLVVDCSVAEGSGAAAQKIQKSILQEMVHKTLAEFNKTIDPKALDIFFNRVGFHPVAVVRETEKLALYCGDQSQITLQDLDMMVGRSREDALFELTDHFGKRNLGRSLTTLHHLLEDGVHALAILATMRNFIRKLLVYRSLQLQSTPAFTRTMAAKEFQDVYLPAIRQNEEWKDSLKGHPYALYMSFKKAAEFKCASLKSWLDLILAAEYRIKGSGLSQKMLLEHLIITMLSKNRTYPAGKEHTGRS